MLFIMPQFIQIVNETSRTMRVVCCFVHFTNWNWKRCCSYNMILTFPGYQCCQNIRTIPLRLYDVFTSCLPSPIALISLIALKQVKMDGLISSFYFKWHLLFYSKKESRTFLDLTIMFTFLVKFHINFNVKF